MTDNTVSIGRGALYVYVESICSIAFGYIFLVVLSKLSTPEEIGILSLILSLSNIFTNVITLGIPTGVQRFLGNAFSNNSTLDVTRYVQIALLIVSFSTLLASSFMWYFREIIFTGFQDIFSLLAIFFIVSSSITLLLRSFILSSLKTKILAISALSSSIVKSVIAITLVLVGMGAFGMTVGYLIGQILACFLFAFASYRYFKGGTQFFKLRETIRDLLHASIASWIPRVIVTIGTQLGTVIVFGAAGSVEAGGYFIALSIFSALSTIMSTLITVAYPALSGMKDGRKRLTWRLIQVSLLISLPLTAPLFFYSNEIMNLIGPDYEEASISLKILLLSMLPTVISLGVNTLIYSYGNYNQVLLTGIASSFPRVVLYFLLVPVYGSDGAAISFTTGSIIGLIVAVLISHKIGFKIFWKIAIFLLLVPMTIAFLFYTLDIGFVFGTIGSIVIPIVIFRLTKMLTRSDISNSIELLPSPLANRCLNIINIIEEKLSPYQFRHKHDQ